MSYSPHRQSYSLNNFNNLVPPPPATTMEQRRMSSPAPPSSLNLSDPTFGYRPQVARPPSPLRNTFIPDTSTGIMPGADDVSDEGDPWDRSTSPAPSLTQLATNFAQRVGSLVSNMSPRSNQFLTDAELEAEAERERDLSRREAERILTQEAAERRRVEERMLELLASSRGSPKAKNGPLPPPPPRSQSMPNPPSPSPSQKEGGSSWWAAAKNKLTSGKESPRLTPAQQIIQETKAKEVEEKKKGKGKQKEKEKEWPALESNQYDDNAFLNLNIPQTQQRNSASFSPSSSQSNLQHTLPPQTPSPIRLSEGSLSPFRDAPPHYAQFNSQGTLDVPGTLLVIAKRFEKLEKWTVGHVRALEDRMSDVERWLVDKEKEKEKGSTDPSAAAVSREVGDIRDEVAELQGRVQELGREMAKMAIAPGNLSSAPSRLPTQVTVVPQTTSGITVHAQTPSRPAATARESTSPPISSLNSGSRTRLPYPSGDYATPPETSPKNSPPSSVNSNTRTRPMSISGLPLSSSTSSGPGLASSGLPLTSSMVSSGLSPPRSVAPRPASVSPTPRKRYTVALGGPLIAPDELPPSESITTAQSLSPGSMDDESDSEDDDDDEGSPYKGETIGKSVGARIGNGNESSPPNSNSPNSRLRTQSVYGYASVAALNPTGPLRPRLRSKSSDRITTTSLGVKFVDPVSLRKQEKTGTNANANVKVVPGKGKVPVGQLVAFFDGGEK